MLYIHDTLGLFGANIEEFREHWMTSIRDSIGDRRASQIEGLAKSTFASVNDVIRNAAMIPQDRELKADVVRARCAYDLEQIFEG